MSRKLGLAVVLFMVASVAAWSSPAAAASCGISVSAQPSVVNYPSPALPAGSQASFSETLDVNYTSAYVNRTITIQYFMGGDWHFLENITGNFVGFTRTFFPLVSGQANSGANSVRALSSSCASDVAAFSIQTDSTAVAADALVYAAIAIFIVLFYFGGRSMGKTKFVLLAAAAYLAIAPFTGHRYDVYFLVSSGIRALQHVNPFGAGTPPAYPGPLKWAYPPLYVTYSTLSYLLYQLLTGASLPAVSSLTHPSWLTSTYDVWQAFIPPSLPVLVFLLKLPMVLSALATGVLLGKMMKSDSAIVVWLANPLVILVAAVWGQLDPIATLLAVAAVYMFEKKKPYHAYLLASFGAAVKVWPILLIPLFFVVSLRWVGRGAARPLAATLPAVLVTLLLYSVFGNLFDNLYVLAYARFVPTFGGAFSVDGLTWQQILVALKAPAVPLFTWVGIPALAVVVLWTYYARDEDVTKWLVVSLMITFLTYNFVNPQYFYWIVPFLMLQRKKLAALAFSLIPILYMMLAYDIFYFVSPAILPSTSSLGASVVEQLKVSAFSQTPDISSFAGPLLPTVAYGWLLYHEIKHKAKETSHPDVLPKSIRGAPGQGEQINRAGNPLQTLDKPRVVVVLLLVVVLIESVVILLPSVQGTGRGSLHPVGVPQTLTFGYTVFNQPIANDTDSPLIQGYDGSWQVVVHNILEYSSASPFTEAQVALAPVYPNESLSIPAIIVQERPDGLLRVEYFAQNWPHTYGLLLYNSTYPSWVGGANLTLRFTRFGPASAVNPAIAPRPNGNLTVMIGNAVVVSDYPIAWASLGELYLYGLAGSRFVGGSLSVSVQALSRS